jgi:predicted metal-dependent peptidase
MIEKKLEIAKSRLMIEHPYFGTLASALKFEKNDNIEAFMCEGNRYIYNDDYLETLSDAELSFTLANAAMHQALYHDKRQSKRMGWMWYLATDYAINAILVENGLLLPDRVNYDSRFEGQYAEEIYEVLRGEIMDDEMRDEDEDEADDLDMEEQQSEKVTSDESKEAEEAYELFLEQVHQKLEKQGDLPRGIERVLDLKKGAKISWREELYRYVNTHAKSDYRFFPPNMKYLYLGFALPAIYGEELHIAVAVDTSASVDKELLEQFLAELAEIMQVFPSYKIELIECDAKIQHLSTLYPTESLSATLKGGGGTDFRPVFDYLDEALREVKFLLYFTDGMGKFPTYLPRIDTLWVMPKAVAVPFGEVLEILDK